MRYGVADVSPRIDAMPLALTLPLDAAASAQVSALWHRFASAGFGDDMLRLGYPPHVTVTICPDDPPEALLRAVATKLARTYAAIRVSLATISVFAPNPATVFLAPRVTPALLALHAAASDALAGVVVSAHYRRDAWVPHVTLAENVVSAADAIRALEPLTLPIEGVLDCIELVRFRPVRMLASHRLRNLPPSVEGPPAVHR